MISLGKLCWNAEDYVKGEKKSSFQVSGYDLGGQFVVVSSWEILNQHTTWLSECPSLQNYKFALFLGVSKGAHYFFSEPP